MLVLHEGQGKQCNHCLKVDLACPAGAEGKQCRTVNKTPKVTGFKSLREKHQQQFPSLSGSEQLEKVLNEEEKLPITDEPQYLELKSKVEELSAALSSQNKKTEEVEQLLQFERRKTRRLSP